MRLIISLSLAILIISSSLIAAFPSDHSRYYEVHFIAGDCDSRDCSRTSHAESCNKENACEHNLFNNNALYEISIPQQKSLISAMPPPQMISGLYTQIAYSPLFTISFTCPPLQLQSQRSQILRI